MYAPETRYPGFFALDKSPKILEFFMLDWSMNEELEKSYCWEFWFGDDGIGLFPPTIVNIFGW
jgi:hypothetical protein